MPAIDYFFMNQIPTRVVPPHDVKFHDFNVSLYNMCYDIEEKDEAKKSVYSSIVLAPSAIKLDLESPVESARRSCSPSDKKYYDNAPSNNLVHQASSMKAQDSYSAQKSFIGQNQHLYRKNPLLPPTPVAKDGDFVLKSKIRDLISHTDMLYQKMMAEKVKSNKKYFSHLIQTETGQSV